jgi:4-hydroxy-3-methylbut-2-enyl diphosphate reductase
MKSFEVPEFYRSPILSALKSARKKQDKLKKDFSPSIIKYGPIQFFIARHFGFCYGVENAIEIAFKTVAENFGKKIYLLSEMIHNPQVNADLTANGIEFIMDTKGNLLRSWDSISSNDIVIIPAFGTTIETENILKQKGIDPLQYNTTCPFVEKVWKRATQIATEDYSIIIHGKPSHEETKATFSHSAQNTASLIINDMDEAKLLASYIVNKLPQEQFYKDFAGKYSEGFDVSQHLKRIGVVNQTTMLAEDTQAIAEYLKQVMQSYYQLDATTIGNHFADNRDTLCYATNDNQTAVKGLLQVEADLAIIIGGYNSSNTSHLVELCEQKLATYFIQDAENIIDEKTIIRHHFRTHQNEIVQDFLPKKDDIKILISSGASCPDAIVEQVMDKIASFYNKTISKESILQEIENRYA